MARPAVIVALPPNESIPVSTELLMAGFEVIEVERSARPREGARRPADVALAILDGEVDPTRRAPIRGRPARRGPADRDPDRRLAACVRAPDRARSRRRPERVLHPALLGRLHPLAGRGDVHPARDRRRRQRAGPPGRRLRARQAGTDARRRSPSSTRRAGSARRPSPRTSPSTLQTRKGKTVLLIDADTVTGHVTSSLGIDGVRTVADNWRDEAEGGPTETLYDMAAAHASGMRVIALTDSPLHTDVLDPARHGRRHQGRPDARRRHRHRPAPVLQHAQPGHLRARPIASSCRSRPDVPAIRAAVQLRDVARGLGCRERLAMVVNRANSGVTVEDMETTVGMPALALIRSGGLLFVRAANEGRTVIEMFPKEKITQRLRHLADRVLGMPKAAARRAEPASGSCRGSRKSRAPDLAVGAGSGQRDRSVQLVPPIDDPGSFSWRSPSGRRPVRRRAGTAD